MVLVMQTENSKTEGNIWCMESEKHGKVRGLKGTRTPKKKGSGGKTRSIVREVSLS